MISFRDVDAARMKEIERQLVQVLQPFQANTEASLGVFALMRCARVLLRKYPKATQTQLIRVLEDYLNGRTSPRDDPAGRLVTMS